MSRQHPPDHRHHDGRSRRDRAGGRSEGARAIRPSAAWAASWSTVSMRSSPTLPTSSNSTRSGTACPRFAAGGRPTQTSVVVLDYDDFDGFMRLRRASKAGRSRLQAPSWRTPSAMRSDLPRRSAAPRRDRHRTDLQALVGNGRLQLARPHGTLRPSHQGETQPR